MRTKFRPCIDLHNGQVKQIVGGTLTESNNSDSAQALKTNFISAHPSSYYASLYKDNALSGGHVIMLGPGNTKAAEEAVRAYPGGLQVGGGITLENAREWVDKGAEKVIVTSWLFPEGVFSLERLKSLSLAIGKDKLVVDLSCRRVADGDWVVAMNKWQTLTDMKVSRESLGMLEEHCSEFLVHAADVEGLCRGIDQELVESLGKWSSIPVTYAGGAAAVEDLGLVDRLSEGKVDLTIGSALDIFGGDKIHFADCVKWNNSSNAGNA